jgi:hypothetical protein
MMKPIFHGYGSFLERDVRIKGFTGFFNPIEFEGIKIWWLGRMRIGPARWGGILRG